MTGIVLICIFFITSTPAFAAVLINEIAWMGTTDSHLCNWIEFYNSGTESVDLADWTLDINDTTRAFADGDSERGSGTVIPPGEYWVLERYTNTCPDPVPEVSDWYVAFGNLPNSGATLTLRRADGSIADQVAGGEDWQNVGGDNDSKETAQRTDDGWITATPTPGAVNFNQPTATTSATTSAVATVAGTSTQAAPVQIIRSSPPTSQPLTIPDVELAVAIEAPDFGYVQQPISFSAVASGLSDTWLNSLRYSWNFGDLHTKPGESTEHTYQHPGTYVVTVFAEYNRYEQVARHEITILPVALAITQRTDGMLQIHNTTAYEVDISGYKIRGTESLRIPEHTRLLPQTALVIPDSATVANDVLVMIYDRSGEPVASNFSDLQPKQEEMVARSVPSTSVLPSQNSTDTPTPAVATPTIAGEATTTETLQESSATTDPSVAPPNSQSEERSSTTPWWSYVALIFLLGIAGVIILEPGKARTASDGKGSDTP